MSEGVITVEEALKELRELSPRALWVEVVAYHDESVGIRYETHIEDDEISADTLTEVMAQVRKWKAEQLER